jgi:hypothetical protein
MVLTAHQTAYLPWAGLIHKISLADKFVFFDCVQMSNDDWERRQYIKTANGKILLTVPLKSKGYRDKKLYELEIDNTQNWRKKHWDSIRFAYKKAKFFYVFESFLEDMYKQDFKYLTELNEYFLRWLLATLKIKVEIVRASDMDFEGQKSDLVLDMCKKLGADMYIFGSQGEGYADKEAFERAGVKLYFQQYEHPVYPQLWGQFQPYMSVIDLLCDVGAEKAREIIQEGNITKKELLCHFK